jgi:methyltransferase (TIGR00027 family)
MKPGQASRTAELVCMGRAAAHGEPYAPPFEDPTALALLSEDARARVVAFKEGVKPKGLRAVLEHGYLERQSKVMIARTVAIDEAIRDAASPQVVILGAGLDGRAWRMKELASSLVFEVDHPDSQREKRARAASLTSTAREVRFVSVDFTRDSLDRALEAAGHDPSVRTTWVWEGVVMYLTVAQIEATLSILAARSCAESTLVLLYHRPSWKVRWMGLVVRRLGEPFRSSFEPPCMRALLAKHRFRTVRDESAAEIASRLSPEVARGARFATHLRIATAERADR